MAHLSDKSASGRTAGALARRDGGLPREIAAPSDLVGSHARRPARGVVRVAGRILYRRENELWLADAYASVQVRLSEPAEIVVGDLAVVEGRLQKSVLGSARVVERFTPHRRTTDGEFARLAWQGAGSRLRLRARALGLVRSYFESSGFVEVDTPLRVRSPGLDSHVHAIRAQGGYLITSPEYHMKRLLAGGMPRIFQLVHASRANESGALHEPEFMMLEWYRAFASQDEVMRDTERLVAALATRIAGKPHLVTPDEHAIDVRPPYERMTVREAFRAYAGIKDAVRLAARDENRYFELFVSRVEPALAKQTRPIFLYEYPTSQAALARATTHDPSVAERFELYVGGVELCNGFGELTDPVEQRRRLEHERAARRQRQESVYPIDNKFLAALAEGLPPSAGNALGFDRLLMLALGAKSVAEVQAFPAERV